MREKKKKKNVTKILKLEMWQNPKFDKTKKPKIGGGSVINGAYLV